MGDKIIEVKIAILDRILANIKDHDKPIDVDTLVSVSGIVETFDKSEEFKKQPKSDPDFFYKSLMNTLEKTIKDKEEVKETSTKSI